MDQRDEGPSPGTYISEVGEANSHNDNNQGPDTGGDTDESVRGIKAGKKLGYMISERIPGKRELGFMRQSSGQELEKGSARQRSCG